MTTKAILGAAERNCRPKSTTPLDCGQAPRTAGTQSSAMAIGPGVAHYDFGWQLIYVEQKPHLLPKGTQVELTAHWDNSAANKYNPDPAKVITKEAVR